MNTRATSWATVAGTAAARAAPRPIPRDANRAADNVLCLLLAVYLATLVVEGVLRYVLAVSGVPSLLYLRDAIPALSVLFLFLRTLLRAGRIDVPIAIASALLACHAAYAAMLGVATFSIAFGLKIFMFAVYGMAMWPLLHRRLPAVLTAATVMFGVTAAGVFANWALGTMPWEGLAYETAFGASSTTRVWWIPGGIARLPGFARTSFNAAMILGTTGLLVMIRFRDPLARLATCAIAITAIVLTTSKGMILAFPLAAAWLVAEQHRPGMDGRVIVRILCAVTVMLPLAVVVLDVGSVMKASSFPLIVVSVWDRFASMWPQAFDLLPGGPLALLGAGLGSIGTPQMYGHAPHHFNAADSLAVFMMVNFGVAGLAYCAFPALAARRVAAANPPEVRRVYVCVLVIAYAYGLSINMIEESFFTVFFGLCLGAAAVAWQGPARRTAS